MANLSIKEKRGLEEVFVVLSGSKNRRKKLLKIVLYFISRSKCSQSKN